MSTCCREGLPLGKYLGGAAEEGSESTVLVGGKGATQVPAVLLW